MTNMKESPHKAMLDAVRLTFENMAFLEVSEQSPEVPIKMPPDAAWVSILVNDPIQSELRLVIPQTMLTELAADMFSIDVDQVAEDQRLDIIAEVLNTLAGLFMTNLLTDDQTYQLGLPEHGEGTIPDIEEGSLVWNLQIEGAPLVIVANGRDLNC